MPRQLGPAPTLTVTLFVIDAPPASVITTVNDTLSGVVAVPVVVQLLCIVTPVGSRPDVTAQV